jgi:dipeptide/tripeptide permease
VSESSFWVTGVELGGKRGGLSAAILNTGGNIGGIPAPYLTPLISDHYGWKAGMLVACVLCFFGASLWFWIRPEDDAESSDVILANAPVATE